MTITEIKNLEIYSDLESIGCDLDLYLMDSSLNLKVFNEALTDPYDLDDIRSLILYSSGYIGSHSTKSLLESKIIDSIRGDNKHVMNYSEWEARLIKVFDYIFDYLVINRMGFSETIFNYVTRNKKPLSSKLKFLLNENSKSFFKWANILSEGNLSRVIDLVQPDLTSMIKVNPGGMSILLKECYKNPSIIDIIKSLGSKEIDHFKSDLQMMGGLKELGL